MRISKYITASNRRRVFICSPYKGDIEKNTAKAKELCAKAAEQGYAPIYPPLMYAQFLDESDKHQREMGIECGLTWLDVCDEIWVNSADGVSAGMQLEIDAAILVGKKLRVL